MHLLRAVSTIALISILAVGGLTDESDPQDLACEYPAKDAVYAPTTDLVVTGRSAINSGPVVIYLKDAKNVVQQSLICNAGPAAAHGTWSCQIAVQRYSLLEPGKYT